jgi:hypothetical protein
MTTSSKPLPPATMSRVPALLLMFPVASYGLIVACGLFVATILYGFYAGDALPTATVFGLVPGPVLAIVESLVPYALLAFAAIGAALAWIGNRGAPAVRHRLRRTEIALARLWSLWGLPVIACLLLFSLSSGGWSGSIRTVDLNYNLAGLIPYSDGGAYFMDGFQQMYWDRWGIVGSRRPLAEAFRQLTVLIAQYSYVSTLLVQLALLAIMLYLTARCLVRWKGIWAGSAFVGFVLLLERPFLATTMTEPLGAIWSLLALMFFIEALRRQSLPHAMIGLAALTFALTIRMGSLLTIPALALWIAYVFGGTSVARWRVLGLACGTVVLVVVLNALLGYLYGSLQTTSGANFAPTICGLSLGTDWAGCLATYAAQLDQLSDERAQAYFLVTQAWQNILANPAVFVGHLVRNVVKCVVSQPRFFVTGYGDMSAWARAAAGVAFLAIVPALVFTWRNRTSAAERSFWLALLASILLSAAIVYADAGWRALHVTNILVAGFLASAFGAAGTVVTLRPLGGGRWQWQIGAAGIAAATVLVVLAPVLSRAQAMREIAGHPAFDPPGPNERIVLGGRSITGFLVLPDAADRPTAVPSLHLSDFVSLLRVGGAAGDFGPAQAFAERVPFALVWSPRIDREAKTDIYVAPPRILQEPDAWAWRLKMPEQPSRDPRVVWKEAIAVQSLR